MPAVDAPNLQISFVDAQRGWAMSPGSETSCATQAPLRLWQTVDGAMSWTALAPSGIPSNRCREALSFVNAMTGWLSTSSPNEPASILQTTDGGRTWRSIALSDAPGSTPRPLHAGRVLSISTAMFVDAVAGDGSAARRYVYAFQSNGQGFDYIAAVPNATDAFAIAFDRGSGVARWLLIAPGATSQESRDTGQTWRAFTTDYQQAAPIAPVITFADASVGYATVRGSIQRTTDGGAHWAKIDTPGTR